METDKPDEQILKELEELRRRVAELEAAAESRSHAETDRMEGDYFRLLVENAYDLIVVLNRDGSFRYVSPAVKRMTGYEPEEILAMSPFEFVHPDDLPELMERYTKDVAEPGTIGHVEYRSRRKDGSWFVAEAMAMNLLDDPRVEGIVVNLRDITEFRKAEEELRNSEERYRFLVENLNDVVFTVDTQGVVLYMSKTVERICGYRVEEITGQPFMRFVHPEDLPGLLESFQRTLGGVIEPYEFRVIDKDGSLFHVRTSSRPFEENGQVAGLIGIMTDISAIKQADEARRRSEENFRAMIRRNIHYYRGSS